MKPRILFLCTGNSCRSQMAEGWLRHLEGDRVDVSSAGIAPEPVNPRAILVMKETGIDISHHTSKHIEGFASKNYDFVITVCDNARENCPVLPGAKTILHRNVTDPALSKGTDEEILDVYRKVRDELKEYCEQFIRQYCRESE